MKRTLILVFSLFLGLSAAQAQQQFATLQHGDSISVYYGADALVSAHAAAEASDIITLSSGTFNGINITKAITIRGAGMAYDTATSTAPTIISGDWQVHSSNVCLEGLYINHLRPMDISNVTIVKCLLKDVNSNGYGSLNNSTLINCKISGHGITSSNLINCVHINSDGNTNYNNNNYTNCIIGLGFSGASTFSATNSILYSCYTGGYVLNCYYCVGVRSTGSTGFFNTSSMPYQCINKTFNEVFNTFQDCNINTNNLVNESFALTDSIASSFLGTDGTQVGIYGGQFPFNPRVVNYKATVANQSRADGKLEVTVQPVNE